MTRKKWKGGDKREEGEVQKPYLLEADEGGVDPLVILAEVEDIDPEGEGTLAHFLRTRVTKERLRAVPLRRKGD